MGSDVAGAQEDGHVVADPECALHPLSSVKDVDWAHCPVCAGVQVDLDKVTTLLANATPGPWFTDGGLNPGWVFTTEAVRGLTFERLVCRGADPTVPEPQRNADARLIAAAPALLTALAAEVARLREENATLRQQVGAQADEPLPPPVLTGAHPFGMCVCAECGPPFRVPGEDWRRKPDDPLHWLPVSWMALCPTCGDKRCPGAMDHRKHPVDAGQGGTDGSRQG